MFRVEYQDVCFMLSVILPIQLRRVGSKAVRHIQKETEQLPAQWNLQDSSEREENDGFREGLIRFFGWNDYSYKSGCS